MKQDFAEYINPDVTHNSVSPNLWNKHIGNTIQKGLENAVGKRVNELNTMNSEYRRAFFTPGYYNDKYWKAEGMGAALEKNTMNDYGKLVNNVADYKTFGKNFKSLDDFNKAVGHATKGANDLKSKMIDQALRDDSHKLRSKMLTDKYMNTSEGKAIQDYEKILAERTNPTTFGQKVKNIAHSAKYETQQGLKAAKNAAVSGFQNLSGKVQGLTGLSQNAANIATGAGLGLAAAGLIGGGIALHRHLKKKTAARRAGNMSQSDFDAWNPVDSLFDPKKSRKGHDRRILKAGALGGGLLGMYAGGLAGALEGSPDSMLTGSQVGLPVGALAGLGIAGISNALDRRRERNLINNFRRQAKSGVRAQDIMVPYDTKAASAWYPGAASQDRVKQLKQYAYDTKDMSEQHLSSIVANSILKA